MPPLCPVSTLVPPSYYASGPEEAEVRAYKLGKRRWSYNEVEIVLRQAGTGRRLTVAQAVNQGTETFNEDCRESAVNYRVDLVNRTSVMLHGFLCYDVRPQGPGLPTPPPGSAPQYQRWYLVQRAACCKGCTGPVVRVIQRFGKMGKRSRGGGAASPEGSPQKLTARPGGNLKDPRFLYLSFDEAGTHVGAKTFRLVLAVYDVSGRRLLSTASSAPIRVLANNDVPTGAAHIRLEVEIPADWEGWTQADDDSAVAGDEGPRDGGVTVVSNNDDYNRNNSSLSHPVPRAVGLHSEHHVQPQPNQDEAALAWAEGLAAHYPGAVYPEGSHHTDDGDGMLMLGGGSHGGYGGRVLRLGRDGGSAGGPPPTLLSQASDVAAQSDGLRRQLEDYASVLAPLVAGAGGDEVTATTLAQAVLAAQHEYGGDYVGGLLRSGSGVLESHAAAPVLRGFGEADAGEYPHHHQQQQVLDNNHAMMDDTMNVGSRAAATAGLSNAALWSLSLGNGGRPGSGDLDPAQIDHRMGPYDTTAGELESFANAIWRDHNAAHMPSALRGEMVNGDDDTKQRPAPVAVTQALEYLQRVTGVNFGGTSTYADPPPSQVHQGAYAPTSTAAHYDDPAGQQRRHDLLGGAAELLSSIATQSPASGTPRQGFAAAAGLLSGAHAAVQVSTSGQADEGHHQSHHLAGGVFGSGTGALQHDSRGLLADALGVADTGPPLGPGTGTGSAFHHNLEIGTKSVPFKYLQ